jgi:hypothetical protein
VYVGCQCLHQQQQRHEVQQDCRTLVYSGFAEDVSWSLCVGVTRVINQIKTLFLTRLQALCFNAFLN